MTHRYAIYWAPPAGSPLATFGAAVLGRDADTGLDVPQPALPGIAPERLRTLTDDPRRYGFHGTLKAPFALADGVTGAELHDAVATFAADWAPFTAPKLSLTAIGGFLALVPSTESVDLDLLAGECVANFDRFRAPPDPADIARRRAAGLTERQDVNLIEWGYPYVFEDFQFHLTLTGWIDQPEHDAVRAALAPLAAPYCRKPLPVEGLAVFEQAARDRPFVITGRYAFEGD
jgi:putative phosphonate metabolism protein